jgi:hemerythrin
MAEQNEKKSPFVVEWRDGFSIHIAQIDREHRHLFQLVKRLDVSTADETVDELLDYVVTHFSNEQKLMEDSRYPGFAQHLKLHEQFGVSVAEFLGASDAWTDERVHELRRFLNKWLIGHILTHDLRFGNWYREHVTTDAPEVVALPQRKVGWFDRLLGRR